MPVNTTPCICQSETGGLHPELLARVTASKAAVGDFRKESAEWLASSLTTMGRPDYTNWSYRLAAELAGIIGYIERPRP